MVKRYINSENTHYHLLKHNARRNTFHMTCAEKSNEHPNLAERAQHVRTGRS